MSKLTGAGLVDHCESKLGTPYVYGAKGAYGALTNSRLNLLIEDYPDVFTNSYITKAKRLVGQVCTDCSGLISWYTGKEIGSAQMYSTATKRGFIGDIDKAPLGAALWRRGHVGVYVGSGYCIEAKSIDYGTIKAKLTDTGYTHWLLFENLLTYAATNADTTTKPKNPYKEPAVEISFGSRGEGVRWVQWELREAGYVEVKIDGIFGVITQKAIKEYQQSCKIRVDGIVGAVTRKAFKTD